MAFVLLFGAVITFDMQMVTTPDKIECYFECCHNGPCAAFSSVQRFGNNL